MHRCWITWTDRRKCRDCVAESAGLIRTRSCCGGGSVIERGGCTVVKLAWGATGPSLRKQTQPGHSGTYSCYRVMFCSISDSGLFSRQERQVSCLAMKSHRRKQHAIESRLISRPSLLSNLRPALLSLPSHMAYKSISSLEEEEDEGRRGIIKFDGEKFPPSEKSSQDRKKQSCRDYYFIATLLIIIARSFSLSLSINI